MLTCDLNHRYRQAASRACKLPNRRTRIAAFSIAKNQTTNSEFQEFVNDGGYERREFWKGFISMNDLDTDLTGWDRIMLFTDETGKLAPLNWRDGRYPEGKDHHPVDGVSWFEAAAYCRWKKVRLPSEVEWEYAARGTGGRMFPWGDNFDVIQNWGPRQAAETTPVGAIPQDRSPFGVMDMARNFSEWVEDTWAPYPNAPRPPAESYGEAFGVVRGGHHTSIGWQMRTTYRQRLHKLERPAGTGFRGVE